MPISQSGKTDMFLP